MIRSSTGSGLSRSSTAVRHHRNTVRDRSESCPRSLGIRKKQLVAAEKQLDDLRNDRDAWKEQAQRLALPGPQRERRGLWGWLRRAG